MRPTPSHSEGQSSILWAIVLLALTAAVCLTGAGCTTVSYTTPSGFKLRYTNTVFQKEVGKASLGADGTFSIEGVKNTTPEVVEAAVRSAIEAAKP